jgi:hypothetical protein
MLTILDWRAADDPVSEMDCARISPGESAFKETEVQQDSYHLDPLESMIDQTLADSFPASDPPSWTLGRETKHPNG